MKYTMFFVVLIMIISSAAMADTIYLFNGDVLEGVVLEETDEFIVVDDGRGVKQIKREDVDYVEEGPISEKFFNEIEQGDEIEGNREQEIDGIREDGIGEIQQDVEYDTREKDEKGISTKEKESVRTFTQEQDLEEKSNKQQAEAEEEEKDDEKEGPITIKPKITGSGRYTTY